jgi:4-aminobutyrate aminotransferase/(S)-3-amino-2-methylpropionate transaminase
VEGARLPLLKTEIPGPRSRALAERLGAVECPAVTCLDDGPIFLSRAFGSNVHDVDGNRFVDLMAGFGASILGYGEPELTQALAIQAGTLSHAMGDVYPAEVKVQLLETLTRVLPGDLRGAILSSSGSDAVESAIKTALVATGRPGLVAFEGGYHGLSLGALDATHREMFREPFRARLPGLTRFVRYGDADAVRRTVRGGEVGAILVEPIQGRGGVRVPGDGFLRELRSIADEAGVLLVADEVWTGLGRTGHWLATEVEGVVPDIVALGKGLGGGFPISVCLGRPEIMSRWPASHGESIHTSTHLGNPLGCAVALRVLELLERERWVELTRERGRELLSRLRKELAEAPHVVDVRGRGLLIGIELDDPEEAARVSRDALHSGWIVLGEGEDGRVLTLSPALNIPDPLLYGAVAELAGLLRK